MTQQTVNKTFYIDSLFEKAAPQQNDANCDPAPLIISGYANTTTVDRVGDTILATAWTQGGIENYKKNPIVLFNHDYDEPIGTVTEITPDANGLRVTAAISCGAEEVYQLIKDNVLRAFSVGFRVKDAEYNPLADLFVIKDLELLEISVVSVPCNQDSLFTLSKSFGDSKEALEFKKQFSTQTENETKTEESTASSSESNVPPQEESNMTITKEDLQDVVKSAVAAAVEGTKSQVETGLTGAERLVKDLQKQFEDVTSKSAKELDELKAALKEKADEVAALTKSKMQFSEQKPTELDQKEIERAIIVAKSMGRKLEDTKLGRELLQKAGPHAASATWETQVSMNMQDEIRRKLVIAPLFNQIRMTQPVMKLPVNPEAGYASWVQSSAYGTQNSTGTAQTHQLKELTLTSYKLATKEYLTNEEDEDSMIALQPIIRDAMVRRTTKAIDKGLLLGANIATDPLKGLATYQASGSNTTLSAASGTATVANLREMRKNMGVWGLDPSKVVYIVSTDVYYNLLEDTSFMTMDKVGSAATILTGQIGQVGGSPVLVSAEFASKATGAYGAIAVNADNFLVGYQRDMTFESDYLVEYQQRVLVNTLRMAFQQISTVDGQAVSALRYTA